MASHARVGKRGDEDTRLRRCPPGYTHDLYECCGKDPGVYGRPKGQICSTCAGLIEDGRRARALVPKGLETLQWTSVPYGWPCFYSCKAQFLDGLSSSDARDRLRDAFWRLVNVATTPAPSDTPHGDPSKGHEPWPRLLSVKGSGYNSWSFETLVACCPEIRKGLDELHQAIMAALNDVYAAGKRNGRSVLLGLASGEVSVRDFDGDGK